MRHLLAIALLGLFAVSCIRYVAPRERIAQTTGTCPGACSHYLVCKGSPEDQRAYGACVTECRDIFADDPLTLASYERLSCDDAVAFIEGDSGRGPGEQSSRPADSTMREGLGGVESDTRPPRRGDSPRSDSP